MASRRKSIFEYNAQFHVFDLNGDGRLSRDELKSAFLACGRVMSDDQMSEMLKKHGVTGDTFTESQFSQLLSSLKAALPARSQVMAAFECLDPHGDGFCSAQQLKKSLMNRGKEKYSEAEADELIKASGAVDGQINYKQFIDFMTAHSIDADDPFH